MLGAIHEKGFGVKVNKIEAYKWYSLSAENGNSKAKISLGKIKKKLTDKEANLANKSIINWKKSFKNKP